MFSKVLKFFWYTLAVLHVYVICLSARLSNIDIYTASLVQCKGVAELMTCHLRKSHDFVVSFKKFWGRSGFSSIGAGRLVHASGYQDMHAPYAQLPLD